MYEPNFCFSNDRLLRRTLQRSDQSPASHAHYFTQPRYMVMGIIANTKGTTIEKP